MAKFLSHLYKNYSHLVGRSCTKVISLPLHNPYDRNTDLMSSCPWTSVNKIYPCISVLYIVVCLKCYIRHSPASPSLLTGSKLSTVVSVSTKPAHVLASHSSNSRLLLWRWGWVLQVFSFELWVCFQQCLPLSLHLHPLPYSKYDLAPPLQ